MNIKIGNTPMIKIRYKYNERESHVYAKLEFYNLSGSIKDRVAYYILKSAYENGSLKKGMEIVEATSGNTGIALAAMGSYLKNPVHIYMPDWVSRERVNLMKMYGAKVTLVSKEEGGFIEAINKAKEYAEKNDAFLANQFSNINNVVAHYETTGREILEALGDRIGGFVSGIGTGGTLIGTGKRLKEFDENIKIYALEPDKMPMLSQNKIIAPHKIEGIGDEFIPEIVDKRLIDEVITVNDDDSINMARMIAKDLGIGVGISSGANLLASVIAKAKNEKEIVTVFPDDNKKYISTDLSKPIEKKGSYISSKIKLLNYEFVI